MNAIKFRIENYFSGGNQRSGLVKKNIVLSVLVKGLGFALSFLLVPITIRYIDPTRYGVWLTISSIVNWMSFLDIGLGNGLRNKLAVLMASKDLKDSRIWVSTTYALLAMVSVGLFILFMVLAHLFDWKELMHTGGLSINYNHLILLVAGLFCLQLTLQLLNSILAASHQVFKVSVIVLVTQLINFGAIFLLTRTGGSSLILLVLINSGSPVLVLLLASLWYYRRGLKNFSPDAKLIDLTKTRQLMGSGSMFFTIQIGAIILFQTDNMVIVRLFNPGQVTLFNVSYKLFSIFIIGFNILITPLWSAFTDAYAKDDLVWIKRIMKKMNYVFAAISAGSIVLFFLAPWIYKIWLPKGLLVPVSLSLAMCAYVIVYTWQTIHVYLLNGINKIRLQLYLVIGAAVINLPLAVFFGHRMGLAGVTLANVLVFLIIGVALSFQTRKILTSTATGIFNA